MPRVAGWYQRLPFRSRLLLAIFLGVLVAMLGQAAFVRLLGGNIQNRIADTNAERQNLLARRVLDNQLSLFSAIVWDNANWTGLYNAVRNRDSEWLREHVLSASWIIEPTFIAVSDASGEILGQVGPIPRHTPEAPCCISLKDALAGQQTSGLYYVNNRLAMVAAAPIHDSDASGPAAGALLFARYVDNDVVTTASRWIGMDVVLCTDSQVLAGTGLPEDISQHTMQRWHRNASQLSVVRLAGHRRAAISPLRDSTSLRVGSLIVVSNDTGFSLLAALDRLNIFGAVGVAILVALLLGFRISAMVVRPLRDLAGKARCLARGEMSTRVTTTGAGDEFDTVASSFNIMAENLEGAIQELEDKNGEIAAQLMTLQTLNARMLSYGGEVQELNERLEWQNSRLEALNAKLQRLAFTDGVTGLLNHRTFFERLNAACLEATRYDRPLTMMMIDVDFFKRYNDELGHPAGDEALREIAQVIRSLIRETDFAARYGGEEFAVGLPQTDTEGAARLAERIRLGVQALCPHGRQITISAGVSGLTSSMSSANDLVVDADAALYKAKRSGRNRVEIAPASFRKSA